MDILSLDATDQLQALAALRISARELLEASVVRMDRLNPKLNAVVSRDLDRAYASVQMIDERRARGEPLGLLGGLPMTVKDTFDVEGPSFRRHEGLAQPDGRRCGSCGPGPLGRCDRVGQDQYASVCL